MSPETALAYLRAFGPLTVTELIKPGRMNRQTAAQALGKLKQHGEVWCMEGKRQGPGRAFLWGAA